MEPVGIIILATSRGKLSPDVPSSDPECLNAQQKVAPSAALGSAFCSEKQFHINRKHSYLLTGPQLDLPTRPSRLTFLQNARKLLVILREPTVGRAGRSPPKFTRLRGFRWLVVAAPFPCLLHCCSVRSLLAKWRFSPNTMTTIAPVKTLMRPSSLPRTSTSRHSESSSASALTDTFMPSLSTCLV